jgi:hypothetical protein
MNKIELNNVKQKHCCNLEGYFKYNFIGPLMRRVQVDGEEAEHSSWYRLPSSDLERQRYVWITMKSGIIYSACFP